MIDKNEKNLTDYKIVIFDLDGTLYFQKPFRVRMFAYLAGHIVRHPSSLKDVMIIKKYREVREEWRDDDNAADGADGLDERQYAYVAKSEGVSAERVKNAVSFFMLEAPLKLLPRFRDDCLAEMIEKLRDGGAKIVVYSDYPVEDKLAALQIKADACYTSADERIGCMKPDPKGIRVILEDFDCAPSDALMVGDRAEKDGLAAERNGVDCLILPSNKKQRMKLYNSLKL